MNAQKRHELYDLVRVMAATEQCCVPAGPGFNSEGRQRESCWVWGERESQQWATKRPSNVVSDEEAWDTADAVEGGI